MRIDTLIEALEQSKQVRILMYIISHANPDDRVFSKTYKQISKDLNVSEPTIAKTLKKLESVNTIERVGNGRWLVKVISGYSDTCDGPGLYIERKD